VSHLGGSILARIPASQLCSSGLRTFCAVCPHLRTCERAYFEPFPCIRYLNKESHELALLVSGQHHNVTVEQRRSFRAQAILQVARAVAHSSDVMVARGIEVRDILVVSCAGGASGIQQVLNLETHCWCITAGNRVCIRVCDRRRPGSAQCSPRDCGMLSTTWHAWLYGLEPESRCPPQQHFWSVDWSSYL
jgi:hypothetical protein